MGRKSLVSVDQRFGRLTVLKKIAVKMWECRCDCGKVKTICSSPLLKGNTQSCGCLRDELIVQKHVNLTGQRYGRLVVVQEIERVRPRVRRFECLCDCGNTSYVRLGNLRSGITTSCGCWSLEYRRGIAACDQATHGLSKHALYPTWRNMMRRCYNTKDRSYKNYGGRGIKVCERWHRVENFIADMCARPHPDSTVERKDNDGNYSPENCYWATRLQQNRNRRNTKMIELNGETRSLGEWCEAYKMDYHVVRDRIYRYQWPLEKALITPLMKNQFAFK